MTAKLLFSAEDIAARVAELGEEISAAYTESRWWPYASSRGPSTFSAT